MDCYGTVSALRNLGYEADSTGYDGRSVTLNTSRATGLPPRCLGRKLRWLRIR